MDEIIVKRRDITTFDSYENNERVTISIDVEKKLSQKDEKVVEIHQDDLDEYIEMKDVVGNELSQYQNQPDIHKVLQQMYAPLANNPFGLGSQFNEEEWQKNVEAMKRAYNLEDAELTVPQILKRELKATKDILVDVYNFINSKVRGIYGCCKGKDKDC